MRPELEPILSSARQLSPEELPRLLGDLEEIRTTALARLTAPALQPQSPDAMLDVEEAFAPVLGEWNRTVHPPPRLISCHAHVQNKT